MYVCVCVCTTRMCNSSTLCTAWHVGLKVMLDDQLEQGCFVNTV